MDIIGACEAEGYDFVTKNDNIYIFEDKHNYVFVDTTKEILADGKQNIISASDIDYDVSTISQGYVSMTYSIPPEISPGIYAKQDQIRVQNNASHPLSDLKYALNLEIKNEDISSVEYNVSDEKTCIQINAKPGETISFKINVPEKLKKENISNIIFAGDEGLPKPIFPKRLEDERADLQYYLDNYKEGLTGPLIRAYQKEFEELTNIEKKMALDEIQERIDSLYTINNEAHIFVYNKESGCVSHQNIPCATDENGNVFNLREALNISSVGKVRYSANIDRLSGLPGFCKDENDKQSAERIIKHLDDLNIDIHAPNATGQIIDAVKSSLGEEIAYNDIKPGMVIANYNVRNVNGDGITHTTKSYNIFKVTDILGSIKDSDGKEKAVDVLAEDVLGIKFIGDLDDYTAPGASPCFKKPKKRLYDRDTFFILDNNIIDAASLLHKTGYDQKHLSFPSDDSDESDKLKGLETAILNEVKEERDIISIWQVL